MMQKEILITKRGSGRAAPGGAPVKEGQTVSMQNDVAEMFIGYGWAVDPNDDGSPKIMTTEGPQSQRKISRRRSRKTDESA